MNQLKINLKLFLVQIDLAGRFKEPTND